MVSDCWNLVALARFQRPSPESDNNHRNLAGAEIWNFNWNLATSSHCRGILVDQILAKLAGIGPVRPEPSCIVLDSSQFYQKLAICAEFQSPLPEFGPIRQNFGEIGWIPDVLVRFQQIWPESSPSKSCDSGQTSPYSYKNSQIPVLAGFRRRLLESDQWQNLFIGSFSRKSFFLKNYSVENILRRKTFYIETKY
jgi:hypothetical protein